MRRERASHQVGKRLGGEGAAEERPELGTGSRQFSGQRANSVVGTQRPAVRPPVGQSSLGPKDRSGTHGEGGAGRLQAPWEPTGRNSASDGGISVAHRMSQIQGLCSAHGAPAKKGHYLSQAEAAAAWAPAACSKAESILKGC